MIEKAPAINGKLFNKAIGLYVQHPELKTFVEEINDSYLYWSDVKYKKNSKLDISPQDLWACVKFDRMLKRKVVWAKYNISFAITNKMQSMCHYFDMNFGGSWGNSSIIPDTNKERYLISSLMEEAISSSQMEGAATTRKIAKDMLRKNNSPRSRSEQMIFNNYQTIRFIVENKSEPLTPELLLKVHSLMTNKTLDNSEDEGRFRTNDDVVVANGLTNEVVHTPPSFMEIPSFAEDLCTFFNSDTKDDFIHPIIKAIIIHFMIAYVHPFTDGNGRTARALFYWYMLKNGYWLMEYMSISRIIYKSKPSYEKAYLFSEQDGNDIGYFITYNIRVLELAFGELQRYIRHKTSQRHFVSNFLFEEGINERQADILALIKENPQVVLTVKELQTRFGISNPTARLDIEGLLEKGYLMRVRVNKKKSTFVRGNKFEELLIQDKFQ
ncbi:MAG: Fic family protein [Paludibacteraceae bacterium]|nr:Fic family protein [Paludibacteraceae bacterium]